MGAAVLGALLLSDWGMPIPTSVPIRVPSDVASYLTRAECAVGDIVPGAEKTILWAKEPGQQTPLSIVYLHGFSATRQETAPLSEQLATRLDANLYYTRLTGHGRSADAMLEGSVGAWLHDAREAFAIGRRIGAQVIVIGISMGGALALWLASQRDVHLFALVLMSPELAPADPRAAILTWPWGEQLAELMVGERYAWTPQNEAHARYWTESYPTRALVPMMRMVELARGLDLERVKTPTLVIYSPNDRIVSVPAIKEAFARLGASNKSLIAYTDAEDQNQHVLAGDILSPRSTEPVLEIISHFLRDGQR